MNVIVHGRHLDVSDEFRTRVDEKLERIERFGLAFTTIDVEVTLEANPRQADRAVEVELTARGNGSVIRAEASAADKNVAFDLAYSHLEERIRRAAERRHHRHRPKHKGEVPSPVPATETRVEPSVGEDDGDPSVVYEAGPVVVREKVHASAPMTVEQALDRMEMVGHDFYLFADSDTGKPSVVYRRRGYDYGLIRLES